MSDSISTAKNDEMVSRGNQSIEQPRASGMSSIDYKYTQQIV